MAEHLRVRLWQEIVAPQILHTLEALPPIEAENESGRILCGAFDRHIGLSLHTTQFSHVEFGKSGLFG